MNETRKAAAHWLHELKEELEWLKMDGVPNIVRSRVPLVRIMWLTTLLFATCVCVALIVGSIKEYQHYEVITTNRLVQEDHSPFPALTVCNMNPFTSDYSAQIYQQAGISFTGNYNDLLADFELYSLNRTGRLMSDDEKRRLGSSMDSMLLACSFNGETCNSSDFEWVWHPLMMGCYRFNAKRTGAPKSRNLAGTQSPFSIELYVGMSNFWSSLIGRYSTRGIWVYVHNQTDYPFSLTPSPYLVTATFGTWMSVKRSFRTQFNAWPYSYSECRVDEEGELMGRALATDDTAGGELSLFEQVKATNYTYTQQTCFLLCAQRMTARACGCNNVLMPSTPSVLNANNTENKVCLSEAERRCAHDFYHKTFLADGYIETNCQPHCPLECSQRKLTPTFSYFQYPTITKEAYYLKFEYPAFALQHANQTDFTTYQYLYYNLVSLRVYYDRLGYEESEEQAEITLDSLIGLVGGHLHLFLGMSLLSFVEIVELVALILISMSTKKTKQTTAKIIAIPDQQQPTSIQHTI